MSGVLRGVSATFLGADMKSSSLIFSLHSPPTSSPPGTTAPLAATPAPNGGGDGDAGRCAPASSSFEADDDKDLVELLPKNDNHPPSFEFGGSVSLDVASAEPALMAVSWCGGSCFGGEWIAPGPWGLSSALASAKHFCRNCKAWSRNSCGRIELWSPSNTLSSFGPPYSL